MCHLGIHQVIPVGNYFNMACDISNSSKYSTSFNQKVVNFFLISLFLHENICYGYSLEASCQGASKYFLISLQEYILWLHISSDLPWLLIKSAIPRHF